MTTYFSLLIQKSTIWTSIKTSIFVGTIVNIINQGDVLLLLNFEQISLYKLFLTYSIPYMVSGHIAVKTKLSFHIGEMAAIDTSLTCKNCNKTKISVTKGDSLFCFYPYKQRLKTSLRIKKSIFISYFYKEKTYKSSSSLSSIPLSFSTFRCV